MTNRIDVLDHGFVRLVSYTQPIPLGEAFDKGRHVGLTDAGWTGDLEIVRNARTSYNADWRKEAIYDAEPGREGIADAAKAKDAKLIHYLWRHRHTTPFEAMVFTFEVQAPIFVFRQWHRHRTWSYNEVSARYTELPDLFYIPAIDQIRPQSKTNKQGRAMDETIVEAGLVQREMKGMCDAARASYVMLLNSGVARELARLVLPVNTYSRMFATVDLRNLFHFLELRLDEHAQFEIRVYAEALLRLIEPIVPIAVEAFRQSLKKE